MGRALITSGGADGLYSASIQYDQRSIESVLAAIDRELEELDTKLAYMRPEITEKKVELAGLRSVANSYIAAYNDAVRAAFWGQEEKYLHPAPEPQPTYTLDELRKREYQVAKASLMVFSTAWNSELNKAFIDLTKALAKYKVARDEILAMEKEYDMLLFREQSLRWKKEEYEGAAAPGDPQSMWCADLTEDLEGEVDTIEVAGAPMQVLIQPGGETNITDAVGTAGKLARVLGQSPAQAGLAWALLPGWQRWRPTYRVGKIHSIDYDNDTASVSLDDVSSIAQALPVNQDSELTGIPVEYMRCNAQAFDDGDRVVVEFPGQIWQDPKVIGFETNPQPCPAYAGIFGSIEGLADIADENIHVWNQGTPAGGVNSIFTPRPDPGNYNNAWQEGATVQIGARWKYPWRFINHKYYKMALRVSMLVWDEAGGVLQSFAFSFGSDPKSRRIATPSVSKYFKCTYLAAVNDTGHYTDHVSMLNHACYDYYMANHFPGSWYTWEGRSNPRSYKVGNLNQLDQYNLDVRRIDYDWVDEAWSECAPGAPETGDWDMWVLRCPGTVIYRNGQDPTLEEQGYLALENPCGDPEDAENLFIEQSWSLTGVIDETGVTLADSLDSIEVGGRPSPFGPFEAMNAITGDLRLNIPPIAEKHHVGFLIQGILTADDRIAAIVSGDQPNWFTEGPAAADNDSGGYLDFYGVVDKRR